MHFIHNRCQLGWWPINTGTIQMKLPAPFCDDRSNTRVRSLSRSLALSLAPFKANRYSCNALIPSMRGNAIPRNEKCLSKVVTLERGRDIRWIRAPCSRFLFPHFHFMSLFENLCIFPGFLSRRNFTFRIAIMILLQSGHWFAINNLKKELINLIRGLIEYFKIRGK